MNIFVKTKDHAKACYDLQVMRIWKNLYPIDTIDGKKTEMAKECFSTTNREKSVYYRVLKIKKLSDGNVSNISWCVQLDG